jgi:peptidoglycan/LPS O-acetylase OafA/YrhL
VAEEVRFYVLFPFVVAALALLRSRIARIAALFLVLLLAWKFRGLLRIDMMLNGVTLGFYFDFFVNGMLACLVYRAVQGRQFGYATDALLPLTILAVVVGLDPEKACMPLFFLLLIGIASDAKTLTARLLRSRIMRHIGLISYGLYLFHVPVLLWTPLPFEGAALFAAVFAATYVIAIASYLLIERPFLMLKPSRGHAAGDPVRAE